MTYLQQKFQNLKSNMAAKNAKFCEIWVSHFWSDILNFKILTTVHNQRLEKPLASNLN